MKALRAGMHPDPEHDPPFVIWVSGAPGAGKSTLVRAATQELEAEGIEFLQGTAYPSTGEILEPVLRAARTIIDRVRERAQTGESRWVSTWKRIVEQHAPALDLVLPEVDWARELEPFPPLEPEYERSRLLDHLAALFLRFAEVGPTVLAIDGGEHLDGMSQELLEILARVVRTRRQGKRAALPLPEPPGLSVVLITNEQEQLPLSLTEEEVLVLPIKGLGRDELARLLKDEYGEEIPLSTREKLYQVTRGNPLDIEIRLRRERSTGDPALPSNECAKRLLDFGRYEEEQITEIKKSEPEQRAILQALALMEKPISTSILRVTVGLPMERLDATLRDLEERGYVTRHDGGVVSLQHVRLIYPIRETIPLSDIADLHRRAAEAISAEYATRPYRRFQEVRYHYSRSPQSRQAIDSGFDAAKEAERLYDFQGAIQIYRELVDALEHEDVEVWIKAVSSVAELLIEATRADERYLKQLERSIRAREHSLPRQERASLWRRMGSVAAKWGLPDKEATYFRRGLDALEGEPPGQERVLLHASVARACLRHRRYDETLRYLQEEVSELLRVHGLYEDPEFLEILRVTEEVHFHRGEYVEALEFEERYLNLARQTGRPIALIDSLLRISHLYDRRGDQAGAWKYLAEARPIARATGSRLLEAKIDERLGYLHARREEWAQSSEEFRRALEVHTEIGEGHRTVRLFGALGMVSLFTGDVDAGARSFRLYALYLGLRARPELPPQVPAVPSDYRSRSERDEEIRAREAVLGRPGRVPKRMLVDTIAELADLRRDRGEFQLTRATVRRGRRLAAAGNLDTSRFDLQLGILHRMQGEVESALECFQNGLDAMTHFPDRERVAEIHLQVGLLYKTRGAYRRCLSMMIRALRAYLELEHETGVAHALVQLAYVYCRLGRRAAAEELGLAALALADTLHLDRWEAEAWLVLAVVRSNESEPGRGQQEVTLARELFNRLGILEGRCRSLLVEGEILHDSRDNARALTLACEALEIARDLGLRREVARGLALRGWLEGHRETPGRDFLRSLKTLEAALEHAQAVGDRRLALQIHTHLASIYDQWDRPSVARSHLRQVRGLFDRILADCPQPFRRSFQRCHGSTALLRQYDLPAPDHLVSEHPAKSTVMS